MPGSHRPAATTTVFPETGPIGARPQAQPALDTSCPRCGYDQTGVIGTWRETCPLTGTCSECGLEFRWGDVLNPLQRTPIWYVERASRPFVAGVITVARAMYPSLFWKRVPMGAPFRPRRLLVAVIATLSLMYAVLLISVGYCEYKRLESQGSCVVYSPVYTPQYVKVGNRFSPSAVVRIVVNPLVALPEYMLRYGEPVGYDWRITTLMQFTFLLPVLVPVAFVFLPFSMRRCRVRREHLIRIACLALCGNLLILSAVYAAPGWFGTYGNFHAHPVMDVCRQGPITIAWSTWFWASAVHSYLRMPHAWGVSLAVHFIAASLIVLNPFMLMTIGSYL